MEEATFKEIMAEYFPELLKGSNSKIQFQAEYILSRINKNKSSLDTDRETPEH